MKSAHSITDGYKKTKVGIIPSDWEVASLGSLVDIQSGNSPNLFELENGGVIPYIKVEDLNNSSKYQNTSRYQTNISKGIIPVNSVLFPKRGAAILNNKVRINEVPVQMDSNMMAIYPKNEKISHEYLYYKITFQKLFRIADTSTIPQINNKHILPYRIPLPPLPEQQKIAEILSTWDQAISTTQKLIDELKLRNKGLAQQLLTGKKRLKGFDGMWEEQHLEHYFKERKECNHPELPLLSVGEIGVYPQTDSNKKDTSNEDKSKYKRICPGDIGYNTMRMWQGRSALSSLEGIVSPAYTIVTPKRNADAQFFSYLFKLDEVIHKFFRKSQGLVSDTLNCKFKDFKIVKVLTPPSIEEQKAITKVLQKADEELKLYQLQIDTLKEQKKGLMQKLLTGKKRVKTDSQE